MDGGCNVKCMFGDISTSILFKIDMLRLHLTVLTTRNETWRLWKQIFKF